MTRISGLYRYPVKSMQGESIDQVMVTERGVDGDRAYALVDVETGRIASCHHPDKWGLLLHCAAQWDRDAVAITLPDGSTVTTDGAGEQSLSVLLGRRVRFVRNAPKDASYELVVADVTDSWPAEVLQQLVGDPATAAGRVAKLGLGEAAPAGSLVDVAPVHLLTTGSLTALKTVGGDTDTRRFRPNIVVDTGPAAEFTETAWNGRTARIGDLELTIVMPTMRCLVPTLAQRSLERHRATLVALTAHNLVEFGPGRWATLGSYATVTATGTITIGDELLLQ